MEIRTLVTISLDTYGRYVPRISHIFALQLRVAVFAFILIGYDLLAEVKVFPQAWKDGEYAREITEESKKSLKKENSDIIFMKTIF